MIRISFGVDSVDLYEAASVGYVNSVGHLLGLRLSFVDRLRSHQNMTGGKRLHLVNAGTIVIGQLLDKGSHRQEYVHAVRKNGVAEDTYFLASGCL